MKNLIIAYLTLLVVLPLAKGQSSLQPCRGENGLFGYCNRSGEIQVDYQFFDALEFVNGHAAVLPDQKWGIINESGHFIVQPEFDEVINCANLPDQILVRVENKWHFINAYGIQLTREYEVAAPWYEFNLDGGTAYFKKDTWFAVIRKGKWGIVDVNDEIKMPFDFDWARVVRSREDVDKDVVALILKKKGKFAWQRVDASAATGFDFDGYLGEYDNLIFFRQGKRAVILDGQTGKPTQQPGREYFNLIDYRDSVGLVSAKGEIILPFKYHLVDLGKVPGYAVFGYRDEVGLADLNGTILLSTSYKEIKYLDEFDLIAVKNIDNKVAIVEIRANGVHPVTEFKYDYAVIDNDRIRVKMGTRHGFVSATGVETWRD